MSMQHTVQQVLVVEYDTFRICAVIIDASLGDMVFSPIYEVDKKNTGIEIRVLGRILQDFITLQFLAPGVLHYGYSRMSV